MRRTVLERLNGKICIIAIIPIFILLSYGGKALADQAAGEAVSQTSAADAPAAAKKKPAVKHAAVSTKADAQKIARQLDFIAKEIDSGRTDYDKVKKLGEDIFLLPLAQVNKVFSQAIMKHPKSKSELNIGWAAILSNNGQCIKALERISGIPEQADKFWENYRLQTLQKCKSE